MIPTGLPIEGADYFVRMLQLPDGVRGAVRLNSDSTYSVYINPQYDFDHELDTWEHELWHIIREDLHGEKDVRDLEFRKGA